MPPALWQTKIPHPISASMMVVVNDSYPPCGRYTVQIGTFRLYLTLVTRESFAASVMGVDFFAVTAGASINQVAAQCASVVAECSICARLLFGAVATCPTIVTRTNASVITVVISRVSVATAMGRSIARRWSQAVIPTPTTLTCASTSINPVTVHVAMIMAVEFVILARFFFSACNTKPFFITQAVTSIV